MPPIHAHLLFVPRGEVADAHHADSLGYLRSLLDSDVTVSYGDSPPPETHVLAAGRPTHEQVAACPNLRALVIPFAGLPTTTRDVMVDFPQVALHNLHHNAAMTAEMALALLLTVSKRIVPSHNTFRRGDWTPRFEGPRNLHLSGRTALVLGYGAVGQQLGGYLHALGMHVLGVRRHADGSDGVHPPDALPDLLPRTDALIVCLPGTPETEGLVDADALAALPEGAVVVNVGRAAVIDEGALYAELARGHLFGAGLDVWYSYPPDAESRPAHPPSTYPFHTLDNVVMSPHRAGGLGTPEVERARMAGLADAFNAMARGERIPHPVNLNAGY